MDETRFGAPRRALLWVTVAMLAGCSSSHKEPDRQVTVLFTSDEHSHLFAHSPELDDYPTPTTAGSGQLIGGVARRAAVFARERAAAAAAGQAVVTVSAGDNQMGGLSHAAFTYASVDYGLMAALGYDVTTLGNHELDFGPAALAQSITVAKAGAGLPPIVASNVHFSGGAGDADLAKLYSATVTDDAPIHPYRVLVTSNGLRIGVFGYVGVNAEHVAPNKTPVTFSARGDAQIEGKPDQVLPKLYADLQPVVDKLRNDEAVDLVIALSHSGLADPKSGADITASDDYQVAQNVGGIDLIVSGHQHLTDPTPVIVAGKSGRSVLVLNAGRFGEQVGRVVFTVHGDGSAPTFDPQSQALLPVDDRTVPDPDRVKALPALLATIEKATFAGKPFLPSLVARVEGSANPVMPITPGDLYFRPITKTDFDLTDIETIEFLSSDAMRAAAAANGKRADMGFESAGVIRGVLKKGKTGVIALADAFDVVPLGSSPVDGTLGYPLVRADLNLLELRAVFEFSLTLGPTNNDYRIYASGVRVEYDASRPPVQKIADILNPAKGQVMRLLINGDPQKPDTFDKVIYDRQAMIGTSADLYSVVTSSYMAQFATDVGASLKDDAGKAITLAQAILHRPDGSEIKHFEALLQYLKASAAVPALYGPDAGEAAKRVACIAGCK